MVVSSSSSTTDTSSTTLTSDRRLSGLISGLDTDKLVKQLTAATQSKIDKQKQKSTTLTWKQQAYREIITKMSDFESKYFSYTASSTNIMSKNFFDVASIKSSSSAIKVSGDTTAAKSMRVSKVTQLATQARANSSHKVTGAEPSLTSGYIQQEWKDTAMGDAAVVLNVDGVEYSTKLDGDLSLPTVDKKFKDSTGTIRTATPEDVQEAIKKALNESLKSTTYKDSKDATQTKDLSGLVEFTYDSGTNKFTLKNKDTAEHKVKIVDYTTTTVNNKLVTTERTSAKLLAGIGMKTNNTESTLAAGASITANANATTSNYYAKTLAEGSYIKIKFRDDSVHTIQIASNTDLDTTGETDPAKAFQTRLKSALSTAILQEGLEDDLKVDVSSSGISFTATGATNLKDKFTIIGGSDNLINGFGLASKVGAAEASNVSGTFTALDSNLYTHKLGDSLAGSTLTFKLNGISKDVTFDEADKALYDGVDAFGQPKVASYLQGKLASAFGDVTYVSGGSTHVLSGTPKVNVEIENGALKLTTNEVQTNSDGSIVTDGGGNPVVTRSNLSTIEMDSSDNANILGVNGALRTIAGSMNRISANQTLKEIGEKIGFTQLQKSGADSGKYGLNVNGKNFVFDENTTLAAALSKINSDTDAGVTIGYSSTKDTMSVISDDYGAQEQIAIKEYQNVSGDGYDAVNGCNFATKLFGTEGTDYTVVKGEDAQLEVSFDNGYTYQTITRSSNSFAIDGVSLELTSETDASVSQATPITFTVTNDTDALFDKIKKFVDDYNDVITAISSKTSESRAKDDNGNFSYVPLTDDQKKGMTQTEIDNWEKKAKQGILNNESNLSSALYNMSDVMSGIVESSGVKALSAIGIATDPYDWTSNGKLIITESTLKAKIAEDPDAIAELFTNSTDGIAAKLKKVLDRNVGTFGGSGILITFAGKDNSTTSDNNNISSQLTDIKQKIKDLKARLQDEQDRYYAKFTYMEQQLSRITSQSSMFSQYGS